MKPVRTESAQNALIKQFKIRFCVLKRELSDQLIYIK